MLQCGKHYPAENWQCIIFFTHRSQPCAIIHFLFFGGGAVLGLRCYAWAFSSCGERGLLFIVVCVLLTVVASLVAEHGL